MTDGPGHEIIDDGWTWARGFTAYKRPCKGLFRAVSESKIAEARDGRDPPRKKNTGQRFCCRFCGRTGNTRVCRASIGFTSHERHDVARTTESRVLDTLDIRRVSRTVSGPWGKSMFLDMQMHKFAHGVPAIRRGESCRPSSTTEMAQDDGLSDCPTCVVLCLCRWHP
ncbi:hypothetical protein Bbelb_329240 [Branchiostoma belcheri]|nr:hypothetical protein Bbelb_329240 [Branchiostoma belcheri]